MSRRRKQTPRRRCYLNALKSKSHSACMKGVSNGRHVIGACKSEIRQ